MPDAGIVTLTMNPAVDWSVQTPRVVPEHKLRCEAPRQDPGGGGINVARVIRELGGRALALYPVGGLAGQRLHTLLDESGIEHDPLPIAGSTRESWSVLETQTNAQFRFVLPGPELRTDDWRRCLKRVSAAEPPPRYVVASGSLPPGVPDDFYARLADVARALGARLALDTSGPALREGAKGGVYLLKPNLRELGQLAGEDLSDEAEQERAARTLVDGGMAQVVVVSLAAAGVLLVSADVTERIRAPTVPIRSRVGAGDSTVAGIIVGLAQGDDIRRAVRRGVAAGSAAVMTPGTELCRREDAERLYARLLAELRDS
jgi:6-phosphofructokinase 2